MWRKSFIFLLVLASLVSSVYAYPPWVYGKGKESLNLEQTPSEELQLEEVEQNHPSRKERKSQKEDLKDSVGNLKAFVKESIEDEALVKAICDYVDTVQDGIDVMTNAYNEEVEYAKESDERYNRLVVAYKEDKGVDYNPSLLKDFSITVNPFVTYSKNANAIGVGGMVGVGYKDIAVTLGAIKPNVIGEAIKDTSDIMVSAGVAFTF